MYEFGVNYFSITSEIIINEAKKLGFEVKVLIPNKNFYVIKGNGKEVYFKSNDCFQNTALGFKIAYDKSLTNVVLENSGFRIPKSVYLDISEFDSFSIDSLGLKYPLVTKPVDGKSGIGVCVKLENKQELKNGMVESLKYSKNIIIQEFIEGEEYRIFVIGDEVIAGINRIPAFVIGNGKNTIIELIDIENTTNPLRSDGHTSSLSTIKIDKNMEDYISKFGYDLNSIPGNNENIQLIGTSNLSSGGVPVNITDKMGEKLKQECVNIAKTIGLKVVGIDIITKDLSKSLKESGGAVIEVNADPGFRGCGVEDNILAKTLLKKVFNL